MGFLDTYSGSVRVDIDDKYHINIKRYLSNADYNKAQEALVNDQRMDSQGIQAKLDTAAYVRVLVRLAIVDWNLDDSDGKPLLVTEDNLDRMPQIVIEKVYEAIEANSKERSPVEQGQFLHAS